MTSCKQAAAFALGLLAAGCGYGPISPAAYKHAKELYTLSNMRSTATLDAVEAAIETKEAAGDLPPNEAAWLRDICNDCRAGEWKAAQSAARRMMEDQVRR